MGYVILLTQSPKLSRILYDMEKNHPEFEGIKIKGMKKRDFAGAVRFYKDNGMVLSYIYGLLEKYPGELHVFGAEMLSKAHFPKIIAKGGKWMADKNHRKLKSVPAYLNMSKEEIESIQLKTKTPIHSVKDEIAEQKKIEEKN